MADPRRLIEQLGPGFERDLLLLGGTERAPSAARRRVETSVLGVAVLASAVVIRPETAGATGATGVSTTTAMFTAAAKWLAIGAFAGGALGGAAIAVTESSAAVPATTRGVPAISRQIERSTAGIENAAEPPEARHSPRLSAPQEPARATRRPSGTVWIGTPLSRSDRPRSDINP
jgi:hypothetical protein